MHTSISIQTWTDFLIYKVKLQFILDIENIQLIMTITIILIIDVSQSTAFKLMKYWVKLGWRLITQNVQLWIDF